MFGRSGRKGTPQRGGTRPIIAIATVGIAIGMIVMILAVSIVTGFQHEIRSKVIGFGSHIQITNFDANNSIEATPISMDQPFYPALDTVPGVHHIQVFATKAGIIKTDEEIQGVVVKGVGEDFDWEFFEQNMDSGRVFRVNPDSAKSKDILISKTIARKLKVAVSDPLVIYFIQREPRPRPRKFTISGIYETSLEQFDNSYVIADIRHIRKLNRWDEDMVSGFEVLLQDYDDLERMDEFIYKYIGFDLNSTKITDQNPDIFGWLELQDINVIVIITLMIFVAGITMSSALLILILERTNMIGILKAMGAQDFSVQMIFIYNGAFIILRGLLWGNILGIALCFTQSRFGIITLPKESYYIEQVPIHFDVWNVALLDLGTLVLCTVVLLLPSFLVTQITPVKAIRFN